MGSIAWELPLGSLIWELGIEIFGLGDFVWDVSRGTFAWDLSPGGSPIAFQLGGYRLRNFSLGTFTLKLSSMNFRSGTVAVTLSVDNFILGSFYRKLPIGICRFVISPWYLSLGNFNLEVSLGSIDSGTLTW